jgi:hypothetical protein
LVIAFGLALLSCSAFASPPVPPVFTSIDGQEVGHPNPDGRYSLNDAIVGLPFAVQTPRPPQIAAEVVVTPSTLGSHINTPGLRLILEPGNYGNRMFNSQDQQIVLREGVYFGSLSIGGSARRISIRNQVPRSGNMTNITTPEGGWGGFPEDILIDGIRSDAGGNRNFVNGQRIAIINSFIRTVDFPLSAFNAPPTGYNDIIIANCYLENYGGTLGEQVHPNQAGVRFHNTNRLVFVDNRVNKIGGNKHVFRLHGGHGTDIDHAYIGRNVHSGPGPEFIASSGAGSGPGDDSDILRNIWYVDNWLSTTNAAYGAMIMVTQYQGFLTHLTMRGNTYRGPTPSAVHVYNMGVLPNEPGWVIEDNDLQSPYQDPPAWEFK